MSDNQNNLKGIKAYYNATFFNANMLCGELLCGNNEGKEWHSKDEYIFALRSLSMIIGALSCALERIIREFESE
jgi:hypothetical protein